MSTISTLTKMPSQHRAADIIRSVKMFLGIPTRSSYKRSRILRRPTKMYEEFIFKGYDLEAPGSINTGAFKEMKWIFKN